MINPDLLNYHHLRYFWVVAREGSIARACVRLHVSQPTISGQLRELETSLGGPVFIRRGRELEMTPLGQTLLPYADDIFAAGRDLVRAISSGVSANQAVKISIGISDQLPKLASYRLIEPALKGADKIHLICSEDKPRRLFAELAVHALDVVLSDIPLDASLGVRGHNHLLGESPIAFFIAKRLATAPLKKGFPATLASVPLLLPSTDSPLRHALDDWFMQHQLIPQIAGEFGDSALLKSFGQAGVGAFAGPAAISDEICQQYEVSELGRAEQVKERWYAVSLEKRLTNPAVIAITRAARKSFGNLNTNK
jgi:LysR family transcriptional regulator, transcriptional activator of nhaA